MTKTQAEVARLFGILAGSPLNFAGDVYPGYPALVIVERELRSMAWGFPLARKSERTGQPLKPKPVNNARTDKLGSFFWRDSFEHRRCLIPLTAWAEYEGPAGRKTKVWQSVPEVDIFACAGIWRKSDEWGESFSMVMTDAAGDAAKFHSRMPVILRPDQRSQWLGGTTDEALALCQPYSGTLRIDRTD